MNTLNRKISTEEFFDALWQDYLNLTPQVHAIQKALQLYNSKLINDHVAFRTFDIHSMDIAYLEQFILELGYKLLDQYRFPEKHLSACAYVHPDKSIAKIFLSQLHIDQLSERSQKIICQKLSTRKGIPNDSRIFYSGRSWGLIDWEDLKYLRAESEYAAWLMVLGFHANHFTLNVNAFNQGSTQYFEWPDFIELMTRIEIEMNADGGMIKGSPDVLLEQASTLADEVEIKFDQGTKRIKSCFFEFAKRFPQENGEEYPGFVAANANQIFSSTDSPKE